MSNSSVESVAPGNLPVVSRTASGCICLEQCVHVTVESMTYALAQMAQLLDEGGPAAIIVNAQAAKDYDPAIRPVLLEWLTRNRERILCKVIVSTNPFHRMVAPSLNVATGVSAAVADSMQEAETIVKTLTGARQSS